MSEPEILTEPIVGAAAMMAIRVLLDHHVPEQNIFFLTLLATPQGTCRGMPRVPRQERGPE